MTKGILRKVSHEIDEFEMEHYNEDKKGMFEHVQTFLNEIDEIADDLYSKKHIDPESVSREIQESLMEANVHIDCMESLAVQNGLVRSKHLQNLLLAAKNRNVGEWHNPNVDHVKVTVPWYSENNLIEKLYLKYHKTRIHRCFDMMQRYLVDDDSEERGIYAFWKEIEELWDEVWDEETLSNHYHDDDDDWDYDIDPKECKNVRDFFKKRITTQIKKKLEQAKKDEEKEEELKILRAKENKLKKYTSIEEFSNNQLGSVYLFVDVKQKFAKSKKLSFGVLYVGQSSNFNSRFTAYAHKDEDSYSELEKRLSEKLPKISKPEIKAFVKDREQCKLRVITNKKLSNSDYRLRCERRLIAITQPLLNLF